MPGESLVALTIFLGMLFSFIHSKIFPFHSLLHYIAISNLQSAPDSRFWFLFPVSCFLLPATEAWDLKPDAWNSFLFNSPISAEMNYSGVRCRASGFRNRSRVSGSVIRIRSRILISGFRRIKKLIIPQIEIQTKFFTNNYFLILWSAICTWILLPVSCSLQLKPETWNLMPEILSFSTLQFRQR